VVFVFHEAHFAPTTGPFPVASEIISSYYLPAEAVTKTKIFEIVSRELIISGILFLHGLALDTFNL
jgi:hypothetical protein